MNWFQRLGTIAAMSVAPLAAAAATDIDLGIYEKTGVSFETTEMNFTVGGPGLLAEDGLFTTFLSAVDESDENSYDFFLGDISGAQANVTDILISTTKLELIYTTVSQLGGPVDGAPALVTFSSEDLDGLSDGASGTGTMLVEILRVAAPIPLPAGGVLMIAGFAAFGASAALRRRTPVSA